MSTQKETIFINGFWDDDDFNTQERDEILRWLDGNIQSVLIQLRYLPDWTKVDQRPYERMARQAVNQILPRTEQAIAVLSAQPTRSRDDWWLRLLVESRDKMTQWAGLGDPADHLRVETCWEVPIIDEAKIVGFVDMKVQYTAFDLHHPPFYECEQADTAIGTDDPGLLSPSWYWLEEGEDDVYFEVETAMPDLDHLLAKIRTYQAYLYRPIVVVSSDDRYARELESEGIPFFKYEPEQDTV